MNKIKHLVSGELPGPIEAKIHNPSITLRLEKGEEPAEIHDTIHEVQKALNNIKQVIPTHAMEELDSYNGHKFRYAHAEHNSVEARLQASEPRTLLLSDGTTLVSVSDGVDFDAGFEWWGIQVYSVTDPAAVSEMLSSPAGDTYNASQQRTVEQVADFMILNNGARSGQGEPHYTVIATDFSQFVSRDSIRGNEQNYSIEAGQELGAAVEAASALAERFYGHPY